MKKFSLAIFISLVSIITVKAQNEVDALRYSQITFGGTARSMGMGGAFGALGADFSSLSTNPAGIGLYKKSELTFTPSFYEGKTSSSFNGTSNDDSKYNLNISNVGLVVAFEPSKNLTNSGWKNFQFGFGMNRYANFNNRMMIEGFNSSSSLLSSFVNEANGTAPSDLYAFDLGLAYKTDLIYSDTTGNNKYKNDMPNGGVLQSKTVTTNGCINEIVLSFGANYNDKLYFGATIGFPQLRYFEESTYSEINTSDPGNYFNSFSYNQNMETKGNGINLKLGMIYRPADWVRIGAAIHTPTFYNYMRDKWSSSMSSRFNDGNGYTADSPDGSFDYTLETPMRAIGSVAFIIGNYGLISGDYEYVDYSNAKLRSDDDDFVDANNAIRNNYQDQSNIRLGTEWRVGPQFSIRGGYALYGSPYKSGINDAERTSYTAGLGYRDQDFFADFAYVLTQSKEKYYLYNYEGMPAVQNDLKTNNFVLTFGFKF